MYYGVGSTFCNEESLTQTWLELVFLCFTDVLVELGQVMTNDSIGLERGLSRPVLSNS